MYRRDTSSWFKHIDFILLDLAALHLAFLLAAVARFGLRSPYWGSQGQVITVLTLLNILVAVFDNSYKDILRRGYYKEAVASLRQAFLLLLMATLYLFSVQGGGDISRLLVYLSIVIYALFAYGLRIFWKRYLIKIHYATKQRRLLIVTTRALAEETVAQIQAFGADQFLVSGLVLVDEKEAAAAAAAATVQSTAAADAAQSGATTATAADAPQSEIAGIPIVGTVEDAARTLCRAWVDEVLIHTPDMALFPKQLVTDFMEMGVVTHITMEGTYNPFGQKQFMESLAKMPVLTSTMSYASQQALLAKRAMDIAAGILGCMVTALLCLIIGPVIYIKSPGPIFFKQTRVGRNGKKFQIIKFRSMYLDAEDRKKDFLSQNKIEDGMMFKLDFDPRIIGAKVAADGTYKKGFGNFIREWSLDEFPQSWNILKGEMSLVGTRPPTVDEWEHYDLHHRSRLTIKPGLTGVWQVSGRSNVVNFEEVMAMDKEYISNWSLGLDVKIIFKTILVVLRRDGSK